MEFFVYRRIFAFDLDIKRLEVLKKQTKKVAAENVDAIHQDFLKVLVLFIHTLIEYFLISITC